MQLDDAKYKQYAEWQVSQLRNGDATFWDRLSEAEYRAVEPHLREPKRILDLGCGLGRVSTHFAKYIPSPPATYFLADSTGQTPTWNWDAADGFYNNLQLTGEFVKEHGIGQFELVDLQTDALDQLTNIDLIMSFLAVGFHYPLQRYWKRLRKIAAPHAICAFGIRRGTITEKQIAQFGQECAMVQLIEGTTVDNVTKSRIKEDILILGL